MDIAERVDRIQEGRKLVVSLQSRIDNIRMRAGQRRSCSSIVNNNNNNNKQPKVPLLLSGLTLSLLLDIGFHK